ncbi:MAG: hypothetical protein FJ272_17980, partial [Planctomycetes bacterium]|nr:hypothetical protein [Planctomycetota bacterium]
MLSRPCLAVLSLFSACLLLGVEAWATATITETTLDGAAVVTVENRFLRAVFEPGKGGTCADLVHKPSGKRFVAPKVGSLLGNRVWNYADREFYFQWERMPWEHEVQRRAGEVELVMRAAGTVDFSRATAFEKRIVLRDAEAMLRVTYTFFVGQELASPRKIGLWFRNTTSVVGERTVYRFPLDDGIVTL